ncbi:prepilin-type N-terminal cleavage/methylation domain-containing protein [Planctomycetota bacterium]
MIRTNSRRTLRDRQRQTRTRNPARRGMTLLEVVLALAILAISMLYLTQLVSIGIRASKEARALTKAQLMAESIVTEFVAGSQTETAGTIPTDPTWSFETQLNAGGQYGVMQLVVSIYKTDEPNGRRVTFARLMRDPNLAIPVDETEESTDSSATGSTSSTETSL